MRFQEMRAADILINPQNLRTTGWVSQHTNVVSSWRTGSMPKIPPLWPGRMPECGLWILGIGWYWYVLVNRVPRFFKQATSGTATPNTRDILLVCQSLPIWIIISCMICMVSGLLPAKLTTWTSYHEVRSFCKGFPHGCLTYPLVL